MQSFQTRTLAHGADSLGRSTDTRDSRSDVEGLFMNINLVVASGVHLGKVIPVHGKQFYIGRDPHCQLRPASQAISKQHCAILIQEKKVFIKDFGSTNGTFVNDEQLEANSEVEVITGDRVRVGPLDFTMQIALPRVSDSTPIPDSLKSVSAGETPGAMGKAPTATTPTTAGKSASSTTSKPVKPAPPKAPIVPVPTAKADAEKDGPESDDDIAAMLLGLNDDSSTPYVPEGSTIYEMPKIDDEAIAKAEAEKKAKDKKSGAVPSREETSSAASDILRKYMRRPR